MKIGIWNLTLACMTMNLTDATAAALNAPISEVEANAIIVRLTLPQCPLLPPEARDERRDLLNLMTDNPDIFEPLLAARLEWLKAAFSERLDERKIGQCLGVISLARTLGRERANKLVNSTLRAGLRHIGEVRTMSASPENGGASRRAAVLVSLNRLCGLALKMLNEFESADAVDDVMIRLADAELGLRTDMLRYLENVAPLRPDIRPRLEEMYHSADSPLRNNPQLLRVIEAIDRAKQENPPQPDNE